MVGISNGVAQPETQNGQGDKLVHRHEASGVLLWGPRGDILHSVLGGDSEGFKEHLWVSPFLREVADSHTGLERAALLWCVLSAPRCCGAC